MAGIRADVNLNVNTSQAKRSMDRAAAEINKVVNNIGGKQISFNVRSSKRPEEDCHEKPCHGHH